MSAPSPRTPSYRHHKPSGQAVVTLDGRDFYLGRHDAPDSRAEYDRLIAEWLANGRRLPGPTADLTVNEMLLAYKRHAENYYRKPDGRPTSEPEGIQLAVRPLRQLYGHTVAKDFGPLALKAVRQAMIGSGLCRNEVNKRIGKIVRAFKWAVSEEMIPASVHHGLKAVAGLRKGRADVRESEPVKPVPEAFVDAIRPHVARQVWAMVELQRLTAMRPGEVCMMRTGDISMAGRIWEYTPSEHKTEHHDKERVIFIGPRAQAILKPWLRTNLEEFLFQPREAVAERREAMRAARKTPVQPSQQNRAKARPKKVPGDRYDVDSYRRAIAYGCRLGFPHPTLKGIPLKNLADEQRRELEAWHKEHRWHPHQLRHNSATRLRREFSLDAARAVLGHSTPIVTEIYAELDRAKAAEVMGKIG